MQNSSLKKSCIKPGTFSGPKWFKKGSGFLILRYFFVQIVQSKDSHIINSGTGSSCKQRKTGSSRWGTPCCTYRYRIWIFQGAFYSGAHPVFLLCFIVFHTKHPVSDTNMGLDQMRRIRASFQFFAQGCHINTQGGNIIFLRASPYLLCDGCMRQHFAHIMRQHTQQLVLRSEEHTSELQSH